MDFRVFVIRCKVNKIDRFSWDLLKTRRLHHWDKNSSILEQKQRREVSMLLA